MAGFISNLFSNGASKLVEAVGDALDKNITSDEERKQLELEITKANRSYEIEMKSLGIEETKAYLQDTNSAREHQSRVQESEHASWLAKNVQPMLAVGVVCLTFIMFFWILNGDMKEINDNSMKDIVIYILGALTTIVCQVIAFFFGSSQGSKDKQKSIQDIAANIGKK